MIFGNRMHFFGKASLKTKTDFLYIVGQVGSGSGSGRSGGNWCLGIDGLFVRWWACADSKYVITFGLLGLGWSNIDLNYPASLQRVVKYLCIKVKLTVYLGQVLQCTGLRSESSTAHTWRQGGARQCHQHEYEHHHQHRHQYQHQHQHYRYQ